MIMDAVSENLVVLALWLHKERKNVLSSIWLDHSTVESLDEKFPKDTKQAQELFNKTKGLISIEPDIQRSRYLEKLHASFFPSISD